jgi:methyl-accepting chemotaxis protein
MQLLSSLRVNSLRIGQRLNAGFGIILATMVVLVGAGSLGMAKLERNIETISGTRETMRLSNEIRASLSKIDGSITTILLVNDEATRKEQIRHLESARSAYQQAMTTFEKAVQVQDLASLMAKLKEQDAIVAKAYDQIVDFVSSEMVEVAMNTFIANRPASSKVSSLCDEIITAIDKKNSTASAKAASFSHTLRIFFFVIGALTVFLAVGIALLLKTSIVKPLQKGVDVANALSAGDLTFYIESDGRDEVNDLLRTMGNTIEALRGIVSQIKAAANNMASASTQLRSSSEQISHTMTDQSARASQIAASAEEMSRTVVDVAKNASSISESSVSTAGLARSGEETVKKSISEVQKIADTVNASSRIMTSLSDRSKQIGEIVNVINDIADQTNLLALNAAIEAARAGEQGRGFAVVADEVRKLAERTAKATTEISTMIRSIQLEVDSAVLSMTDACKKVDTGVELSSVAGTELAKIVKSIGDHQSLMQQIASDTKEMLTVAEQISNDIDGIAHSSHETSGGSEEIARSSTDLANLAASLQSVVARFSV